MTNREWLHTLKDEEFVEWMFSEPPTSVYKKNEKNVWELEGEPDKLYPRLKMLTATTTQSTLYLVEWLKEKHCDLQRTFDTEL